MRADGKPATQHGINSLEFLFGHDHQPVPPLPQNAHEASCLTYLEILCTVHQTMQEEVAWKHGNRDAMPDPSALGPHLYLKQQEVKALRRELLVDQLLTVTPCVERIPRPRGGHLRWQTIMLLGQFLYIYLTESLARLRLLRFALLPWSYTPLSLASQASCL